MALLTKEALLGASDLVEREVDLPSIGGAVRVRSLPAAYSNQAQSEAYKYVTDNNGRQQVTLDTAKLEILQVLHGLIEPKLASMGEAEVFAQRCGPAFKKVIEAIDEISGVDKKAIEDANARFPEVGAGASGDDVAPAAGTGNGRSDVPARVGARAGDSGS